MKPSDQIEISGDVWAQLVNCIAYASWLAGREAGQRIAGVDTWQVAAPLQVMAIKAREAAGEVGNMNRQDARETLRDLHDAIAEFIVAEQHRREAVTHERA